MSSSGLLHLLSRHRSVVGAVGLISLIGLVAVLVESPPTYRAAASVVLVNPPVVPAAPPNGEVPAASQNAYVQFRDLSFVADILVRILKSEGLINSLKAKGLVGTFEIAANRDFYRGPILDLACESSSAATAITDTNLVIGEIEARLSALQSKEATDRRYFITTRTIVGPDRATTVLTNFARILLAVGGVGLGLTVGSGLLAEVLERRRTLRHDVSVIAPSTTAPAGQHVIPRHPTHGQ